MASVSKNTQYKLDMYQDPEYTQLYTYFPQRISLDEVVYVDVDTRTGNLKPYSSDRKYMYGDILVFPIYVSLAVLYFSNVNRKCVLFR